VTGGIGEDRIPRDRDLVREHLLTLVDPMQDGRDRKKLIRTAHGKALVAAWCGIHAGHRVRDVDAKTSVDLVFDGGKRFFQDDALFQVDVLRLRSGQTAGRESACQNRLAAERKKRATCEHDAHIRGHIGGTKMEGAQDWGRARQTGRFI